MMNYAIKKIKKNIFCLDFIDIKSNPLQDHRSDKKKEEFFIHCQQPCNV